MTSFFYDLPYIRQTLGIDFDATGASLCCDKAAPGQDGKTPRGTPNYRTAADCVWTREMLGRYLWSMHGNNGAIQPGAIPFRAANGARTKKDENGNDKGCYIATAYDLADPTEATYTDSQGKTWIPPLHTGSAGHRFFRTLYFPGPYTPIQDRNFDTLVYNDFREDSGFFYSHGLMVECPVSVDGIWSYAGLSKIQADLRRALLAYCWRVLNSNLRATYYHHSILNGGAETVTGPFTNVPSEMEAYQKRDSEGEMVEESWDEFTIKVVPGQGETLYFDDMVNATISSGATNTGPGTTATFSLNANLETPSISMKDFLYRRWHTAGEYEERSARWCNNAVLSFTRPQGWTDLVTQQQ